MHDRKNLEAGTRLVARSIEFRSRNVDGCYCRYYSIVSVLPIKSNVINHFFIKANFLNGVLYILISLFLLSAKSPLIRTTASSAVSF